MKLQKVLGTTNSNKSITKYYSFDVILGILFWSSNFALNQTKKLGMNECSFLLMQL